MKTMCNEVFTENRLSVISVNNISKWILKFLFYILCMASFQDVNLSRTS